ncbi:MAG: glycoside hydrolase family 43 protein [Anaerolineales bacterium]|nr:glycoside hydrolase family 43 protein [Anaerolineales bacterium]MCX7755077.1 glycoside hydrolase family 43 protein [Anaerolineales bacterium]MDW8277570.1 glycoside hydrolase family 43 protein [Anaerolineales bacterium]
MSLVYSNPLPIKHIGDPFVLRAPDGLYYCYATSAPDGFQAWVSPNLADWREAGYVYQRRPDSWGQSDFWAPEVVFYQGRYVMHYTARWAKNQSLRLGVAIADSPLGPFVDVFNRPMFDFGYAAIDGHVFFDDDGRKYFYYSRDCSENIVEGRHESHLYVAELTDDLLSFRSEPVLVAKPEQEWETRHSAEWRWNEGPFVLKHEGRYFLMYSANFYASREYAVGYAVSESPTGPFVKAAHNPVLAARGAEISGPGHNSVTLAPDGKTLVIVYHIHTDPQNPSGDRQVCIDRMGFDAEGRLFVEGPTLGAHILT